MNLRRLKYYVKIVDIGSLTQAAEVLHIAQPALSQQLAALEGELDQQLLIRTKRGVTPTEAGKILYSHAQTILRQCEQAQSAVDNAGCSLGGQVSVGLAPSTAASLLAMPLIQAVKAQHPGIVLYLNENFGSPMSEQIMNGRMDMAVIYDRPVHGLSFIPLMKEDLFLVGSARVPTPEPTIELVDVVKRDLFMPRPYNVVRRLVDETLQREKLKANIIAEIESPSTLNAAVLNGLGVTILPESAARAMAAQPGVWLSRIASPGIQAPLSFCMSDHLSLSPPAQAVKDILLSLMVKRTQDNRPLMLVH
jgi:LysR family nitrogen assimilation transcriptional regulator